MTKEELAKAIREDYERKGVWAIKTTTLTMKLDFEMLGIILEALEEPKTDKYEYHIDHTDCIWYRTNRDCPVTCSQYRDGWNDAMNYIFKNGDGYRPYRRNENG